MKNSNGNLFLLSSKEESETPTESQVPSLQFFPLLAELSELLNFLLHAARLPTCATQTTSSSKL